MRKMRPHPIKDAIFGKKMTMRSFANLSGIHPVVLTQLLNEVINLTELNKARIVKGLVKQVGLSNEEAEALVLTIKRKEKKSGSYKSYASRCNSAKERRVAQEIFEKR